MENTWTRRQVLRAMVILGTVGTFFTQAAISCNNLFTDIYNYTKTGLAAFSGVENILAGFGLIPIGATVGINLIIALVKAGFADVQVAVNDYNNAPAANKTTLLAKISTVIQDLQNEIVNFWNNLTIPNPQDASLVQSLLEIITTTLAGFQTQLPPPTPVSSAKLARLTLSKKLDMTPHKRSVQQVRHDYNAVLKAKGGNAKYAI